MGSQMAMRTKGTFTNTRLPGSLKFRGKNTGKASKTVVGRCKGMDRAQLE